MGADPEQAVRAVTQPDSHPAGWPKNVRKITLDNLDRLGIDHEDQLHWDGKPIEMRRPLALNWWQKIWAVIVGLALVAGGIGGAMQGLVALLNYSGHH